MSHYFNKETPLSSKSVCNHSKANLQFPRKREQSETILVLRENWRICAASTSLVKHTLHHKWTGHRNSVTIPSRQAGRSCSSISCVCPIVKFSLSCRHVF